ncbi:MAG: nitroreductase family protein [Victivallaceae bacterium]|nr:nitroreductase family protein [Victivallaceae bacterium]
MDFYETIRRRRSIRAYKSDHVPTNALANIVEAARLAPSACNRQPWKLVAVTNAEMRKKLCAVCKQEFLGEAPVILLALGAAENSWKRACDDHHIVEIDLGIMMEHVVLAAAAEGLGTCWVCAYDVPAVNAAAGVSAPWSVLAMSPLGYASGEPTPLDRKPISEMFELWD